MNWPGSSGSAHPQGRCRDGRGRDSAGSADRFTGRADPQYFRRVPRHRRPHFSRRNFSSVTMFTFATSPTDRAHCCLCCANRHAEAREINRLAKRVIARRLPALAGRTGDGSGTNKAGAGRGIPHAGGRPLRARASTAYPQLNKAIAETVSPAFTEMSGRRRMQKTGLERPELLGASFYDWVIEDT